MCVGHFGVSPNNKMSDDEKNPTLEDGEEIPSATIEEEGEVDEEDDEGEDLTKPGKTARLVFHALITGLF